MRIWTYRVEDGRPAVNATIFRVVHPDGTLLGGYLNSCHEARMFCRAENEREKRVKRFVKSKL